MDSQVAFPATLCKTSSQGGSMRGRGQPGQTGMKTRTTCDLGTDQARPARRGHQVTTLGLAPPHPGETSRLTDALLLPIPEVSVTSILFLQTFAFSLPFPQTLLCSRPGLVPPLLSAPELPLCCPPCPLLRRGTTHSKVAVSGHLRLHLNTRCGAGELCPKHCRSPVPPGGG